MSCALGHAVVDHVGELLACAARSFLRSSLGLAALSCGVIVLAIGWAADGSVVRGLLAGFVVACLCLALGLFLSGQRALGAAMQHGVGKLKLGDRTMRLIFDRMLARSQERPPDQGGVGQPFAETLPLAQAQRKLTDAIQSILCAPGTGGGMKGWLVRKLEGRLLQAVQTLTLARFRQIETFGGIDLNQVRESLASSIDARIAAEIDARLRWTTRVVLALMVLFSFLAAHLIRQITV